MSTFMGKVEEFPGISIDRFDDDNLTSEAFFLSHCHTDHMIGLETFQFQRYLVDNNLKLYLSHISAEIIKNLCPDIERNLVELEMHTSTLINLKTQTIGVSPIPAGHCPGSVMFLFEGEEKTVLYTGDFRINSEDIDKFKIFYDSYGNKKRVDTIYLDTTFFLKSYEKFPPRADSLEEICKIIREWIAKSDKHVVALKTSARYGYEYLFMEIYKKLKMPVHVNEEIYKFYRRVPELDKAVTRDRNVTKIHTACGSTWEVICMFTALYKIKEIKISAMMWDTERLERENKISTNSESFCGVCYSTHASYEEGRQLLNFLKPKKVEANVLYFGNKKHHNAEILKNIQECLEDETKEPRSKKMKLFKVDDDAGGRGEGSSNLGLDLSILDSPPRQ